MIVFAPGGKPISYGTRRFPQDLAAYLSEFGLNGFEIECGRGLNISENIYRYLPSLAKLNKIALSLHAPYFISISSKDEEVRRKSIGYITSSARIAKKLGADRIVIHSGSCTGTTRQESLSFAKDTLIKARVALIENNLQDISICPETMGKINQLGTLEEVIELCKTDESFIPCIDFGHLNARTQGGIKSKSDYEDIFNALETGLGFKRTKNLHIHFSKIMYTAGGEKKHLTFEDTEYGPDFEPMIEVIAQRGLKPFIVCESAGTQAEDACAMRKYYEDFRNENLCD
ncbi:MAG: TIM barrel protein [Oscillospiraceae bacterium]|nr:TIM barrel protein [Oscillospiraceae bacterium]